MILTFVTNAIITIILYLTGCLMADQHIKATSDIYYDNNYTPCQLGGAGVLLVTFYEMWA